AYKEPSARQRELAGKWKKDQPKDTGWRTDGARADLSPNPAGGGSGESRASAGKRRRPWARSLAGVLVALLVTAAIIGGPKLFSSSKTSDSAKPATPVGGTAPADTSSPTGLAAPAASADAPPAGASPTSTNADDRYFDGSKSMDWQNNAAGIVPPAAARVGDYSAKTVGDAYAALRQMLITADLDPAVLKGAEPTAAFRLLDPGEGIKQDYEKRVAKPGRGATNDPKAYATRFNPQTTKVLGGTVKVRGSMSAAVDKDGDLIVTGDYSFVYALAPADGQGLDRSMVRRVWSLQVQPTTAGGGSGYWLSDWWYDIANDKCNVADGYINPAFGGDGGVNTGKTVDPYATTPPPAQTGGPSGGPPSSSSSSATECDAVKPV
ncbi:hypothetical protein KGQ20_43370, partial [Catenulispora sp. NF23]|uniref:hypothetical protein n=1 Tax=Catenulispora pinistramenti TaxID=2705254 RepID=UPI001BA67C1A